MPFSRCHCSISSGCANASNRNRRLQAGRLGGIDEAPQVLVVHRQHDIHVHRQARIAVQTAKPRPHEVDIAIRPF
jgi:hypothetical protein